MNTKILMAIFISSIFSYSAFASYGPVINCTVQGSAFGRPEKSYELKTGPQVASLTELRPNPPDLIWNFEYQSTQSVTHIYVDKRHPGTYVRIIGVNGVYSVDFYQNNMVVFAGPICYSK